MVSLDSENGKSLSYWVASLVEYGIAKTLIREEDRVYIRNLLLEILRHSDYNEPEEKLEQNLETILGVLCDYAADTGIIEANSTAYRDLFDTKLMGVLTPRPSTVIDRFRSLYTESPEKATNDYYRFSQATDYIRTYRVCKDLKWAVPSEFGDIDISINLSKPEKDPRAIAAARNAAPASYPKCVLCRETEGYAGTLTSPARQNHRLIPLTLTGEQWYMQYSPYVYYNEHCIVLSAKHSPMSIRTDTFRRMMEFVTLLPHYFIGSNADLPIVGGSILSHDHMQGGRYTFAMERAPLENTFTFAGYENVNAGIVHWPLSVIRLTSEDSEAIINLSDKILNKWREYTDKAAFVLAYTDGEPHNTITPIARRRGSAYEMDLVLRNNITTEDHPLGVYHPHKELHNIKKENIGLIEVMGLAILPARLKTELAAVREAILNGTDLLSNDTTAKHAAWVDSFRNDHDFTFDTIDDILKTEVGKTFVKVLCDAGVYKTDPDGRAAFMRFIDYVNYR